MNSDGTDYIDKIIPTAIIKDSQVWANDLRLGTRWSREEQIVHGKAYDKNGNAYTNKKLYLKECSDLNSYPISPNSQIDSTTTSYNGSFAFYTGGDTNVFVMGEWNSSGLYFPLFKFNGSSNFNKCSTNLNENGPLKKDLDMTNIGLR